MTGFDATTALALLREMWRIRVFEERVAALKRADEVVGLVHLSIGQEAVAAAVCGQLRPGDNVYSGHRAHGHVIAGGAPLPRIMAELMGRADGMCRGLGGSMHLVDTEHGVLGATGVVGGNIPMAAGSALAAKLTGSDAVTVVFFGDGAVQAGQFTETVNLAALWQLPLILVCENNGFAEFTPRSAHTVVEKVSDVIAPYAIERATVDGSDVPAVWREFGRMLDTARTGKAPALLECMTHRLRGHYEGDPGKYREALSDEDRRRLDPLERLRAQGLTEDWFTDTDVRDAEHAARQAVDEAVEFARASPAPSAELAASFVYA